MKRLLLIFITITIIASMYAQAPAGFNYQAIARNVQGQLITNTQVTIQIAILKGDINGISVYTETFSPTTNSFGLVNLNVGNGTVMYGTFSDIDWSTDTYFIKVWLNSTEMGTTQLLSVPYALHAKTAEKLVGGITETDPIYTAWDKSTGIIIKESQISDLQNYLKGETDPVYNSSIAKGITETDTTNWNNKLDNYTETDPVYNSSIAKGITETDTTNWNNKLDNYTETDPSFNAWDKSTGIIITESQITDVMNIVKEVADEFSATESQINFTLSQIPAVNSKIKMFINGVRISNSAYSLSGKVLSYISINNNSYSLISGDRIQIDYYY